MSVLLADNVLIALIDRQDTMSARGTRMARQHVASLATFHTRNNPGMLSGPRTNVVRLT